MVFQRWNPFPKSIYENVAYGPRINGIADATSLDEIVERSLRRATIWDEVKDRLRTSALGLSGGQQQRVCIARALANPVGIVDQHDGLAPLGQVYGKRQPDRSGAHDDDRMLGNIGTGPVLIGVAAISELRPGLHHAFGLLWRNG